MDTTVRIKGNKQIKGPIQGPGEKVNAGEGDSIEDTAFVGRQFLKNRQQGTHENKRSGDKERYTEVAYRTIPRKGKCKSL